MAQGMRIKLFSAAKAGIWRQCLGPRGWGLRTGVRGHYHWAGPGGCMDWIGTIGALGWHIVAKCNVQACRRMGWARCCSRAVRNSTDG